MSVTLHIAGIDVTTIRDDYLMVRILLENHGIECVGPGNVLARQTLKDGTIRTIEFNSTVSLSPGEHTKVSQLLRGVIKEIDFRIYCTNEGIGIPLIGTAGHDDLFRWSPAA